MANIDMADMNHRMNAKNKHLLITGATGGLGRDACEMALASGYQVTAVGRNQTLLAKLAEMGCQTVAMDLRELAGDNTLTNTLTNPLTNTLTNTLQNNRLETPDVIWHCSARSSPWGAYDDFYADNVLVTRQLAKLAGEQGVAKFVHISTPSVYCDYQHHQAVAESYQPHRYVNHYAHTKALAETEIITASQHYPNTHFVMLRPRAIFGRYDQVLLPRLMRVLAKQSRLPLPRGGVAVMDFTYAGNVVHAMQCATQNDSIPSASVFNISNHEPMALVELIHQVFVEQLGMSVQIKPLPYPLLDTLARGLEQVSKISKKEPLFTRYSISALHYDMVLDNTLAINELGYRPIVSMDEGIQFTTDYLKN